MILIVCRRKVVSAHVKQREVHWKVIYCVLIKYKSRSLAQIKFDITDLKSMQIEDLMLFV